MSPDSARRARVTLRLRPWHVYSGALLLLCVLWGAVLFVIRNAEQQAIQNVMRNNANLALAVSQHAEVTLNQADRLALQLRDLLDDPAEFARRSASLKQQVRDSESTLQGAVARADGTVIWSTLDGPAATIRDREHFQIHVERDLGQPFISKPVLGRVSGNWSVQVTRRVNREDGSFAGVVVLSLDPFYFTRRFAQFDIGRSGRVALVGHDGVIRARTTGSQIESAGDVLPESDALTRIQSLVAGQMVSLSTIDHVERLDAFHAVGAYPLAAVVGVARDDALEAFEAGRRNYLVFGALVSVLILGMSILTTAGVRRQLTLLEAAQQARERAELSNARKTEFVGAIAHEVRTPLSNVIGYAQLIGSGRHPPERHAAFARQIEVAGQRVSDTMNDLLEIARIEAGNLVLTPTLVSPRELVADTVDAMEAKASAHGLVLRMDIGHSVPQFVQWDRARVQQVLAHLLDNSIRHAGKGEVTIGLDHRDRGLVLSVSDRGKGIPEELLETLFNRFEGEMSPVALRISGTGLGLSIVKALVERMGGRVQAATHPESGTRIEVSLPVEPAH